PPPRRQRREAPRAGAVEWPARAWSTRVGRGGRRPRAARSARRGFGADRADSVRSLEEGAAGRGQRGPLGRPLLERLLAGGEDGADLEVEVVGVGRRFAGGLVRDDAVAIELEQTLVEGLHAVLGLTLRDERRDLRRALGFPDAVLDGASADEDLDGRDAAFAADLRDETLRDDADDDGRELVADLLLLVRRERTNDAVDGLAGVQGVERREHQVARLRGMERDRHRLRVAHFTDEDHVRVLAERGAERGGEARRVVADLTLADDAADVVVGELDRVLDRDDVVVAGAIDVVDHRRERRRLTRAGDARDQQEPAAFHREMLEHFRQPELLELRLLRRDRSQNRADRSQGQEHVDAEAAEVRHRVRRVDLATVHELG